MLLQLSRNRVPSKIKVLAGVAKKVDDRKQGKEGKMLKDGPGLDCIFPRTGKSINFPHFQLGNMGKK